MLLSCKLAQSAGERYGAFFVRQRPSPVQKRRVAFRVTAIAALITAVGQVTLGGVVRVTDSGLGCPDWPLCFGQVIPPVETATLIEYSHRLSATFLGVLVLLAAALAWRFYPAERRITFPTTLALALVFVAAVLGGITVRTELAWWTVMLHLGVAEAVVACMVVVVVAEWKATDRLATAGDRGVEFDMFNLLVVGAVVGTFALILLGSYMVGLGYGSSCSTWPLCEGSALPQGGAYAVHMAHRFSAVLVGLLIAGTVVSAWTRRVWRPELLRAALGAAVLFLAQVLIGAATVWSGFPAALKSTHLSVATVVWVSLVFLAALHFVPSGLEFKSSSKGPEQVQLRKRAVS